MEMEMVLPRPGDGIAGAPQQQTWWMQQPSRVRSRIPAAAAAGAGRQGTRSLSSSSSNSSIAGKERQQELLWQDFLSDPLQWLDQRAVKLSVNHPDFRHKTSKQALWLCTPGCREWQLAEEPGAGAAGGAELREAVQALHILVLRRTSHLPASLFYRLLKRCMERKDLRLGKRIHALAIRSGHASDAFLANHIIAMYASHGKLEDAVQVFSNVTAPDAHMWATIISAHARHGQPAQAIQLYRRMRGASSVKPDNHLFVAVLKACAMAKDLDSGKEVHAHILLADVSPDMFVSSSLVNMYAKCGRLEEAAQVFGEVVGPNTYMWSSIISAHARHGQPIQAINLYRQMRESETSVKPDDHTFAAVLGACAAATDLVSGKEVHADVLGRGVQLGTFVGTSLVNMYAKCRSVGDARRVFDALPTQTKTVVTWNAMIAGYTHQGLAQQALSLYWHMQEEGVTPPDQGTFVCLLQACASLGALQQGKELHAKVKDLGLEADLLVGNCLVNMYAKCGNLADAHKVFDALSTKDAVTWSALLNGYAEHSDSEMAMQCFADMRQQGVEPDDKTFICLFVACSHAGLVHEGQEFFRMMVEDYGITPTVNHFNCMIDLLARSGHLDEAESMVQSMPFDNVVGWKSLLNACKSHRDVERGRRCFDRLVLLEPGNAYAYVVLATIYANVGRWEDVKALECLRRSAGACKIPAKVCIEVKNEVHEFTVGEERYDISSKVKSVNMRLKEEGGHVPQTDLVLKAMSEQEKEDALCGHAEKLALAYGLLHTPEGTSLLVTKNLRMCNDCHSSTKVLSRLEKREIIVRDAHRVHCFRDGSCTCGDRP